eukprot:TRINITY_DN73_c1_g2_i1.p1 TRINITY_DN73_c1_g2~~TRINITY_DN73_c1_g2_i1.p1  ORF type:complete len:461 (-),score=123.42 TRINITY_DN73_c1_g2_i1:130-1476(-)
MSNRPKSRGPKSSKSTHTSRNTYFADSKKNLQEVYDLRPGQIGEGGFSIVRLAEEKKTHKQFAVKCVKKKKMSKEALEREVTLWRLASEHSNSVVSLHHVFEDRHDVNLIMEIMSGGELFDRIVELEDYTEEYASGVIKQIAKIVIDLHAVNIAHRDLKPENLLLESKESPTLKICDFGLASLSFADRDLNTVVGSRTYMAPEVFDKEKGHGKAVDLYAIGIIMYILLCGYPPFEPENGITELEFPSPEWDDISEEAKSLISALLEKDPSQRPGGAAIMRHAWIGGSPALKGRRSRSRLFNTQKTLRRFRDMKGEIKPGQTMRDYRGGSNVKKRGEVFSLFDEGAQTADANKQKKNVSTGNGEEPKQKKDRKEETPSNSNGYTIQELFYSFQKEIRYQREHGETLRKELLALRAQLAKEQVLREDLEGRMVREMNSLREELAESKKKH